MAGQAMRTDISDAYGIEVRAHALVAAAGADGRFALRLTPKGVVRTNRLEGTQVPGLYVAGDASEDVQLAIVAAAEGAKAGFAINEYLRARDIEARVRIASRRAA
jgi:thioredoxin reductase